MEPGHEATDPVKPPPLNSDQLNYLIWRYLQESGYAEAAVKLQRDWKVEAEQLPFAKHIKGQALVSLVQKGLRYHHLSLTIDENGQPSKVLQPSMFFFGPETGRPATTLGREIPIRPGTSHRDTSPDQSFLSNGVRKHAREGGLADASDPVAQPVPKRSRKSTNNATNLLQQSTAGTNDGDDAMEIDGSQANGLANHVPAHRDIGFAAPMDMDDNVGTGINRTNGNPRLQPEVSASMGAETGALEPHDQEQRIEPVPPTPTLTNGESVGIQVVAATVTDLQPGTAILAVSDGQHVTQVTWRTGTPLLLTATGVQFCGVWEVGIHDTQSNQIATRYHDLFDQGDNAIVSAVAWDPTGSMLAIATYSNERGQLHLYDGQELTLIETLPASQRVISSLRWQAGLRLVGVAPYDAQTMDDAKATSLILWDLSGSQDGYMPSRIQVPEVIHEIDSDFDDRQGIICASGDGVVYQCRVGSDLEVAQRFTSNAATQDTWAFVKCRLMGEDKTAIIAASAEAANLWIPSKNILLKNVHNGAITSLAIRPHQQHRQVDFATSSTDGTVKMWRFDELANTAHTVVKVTMGSFSPIMACAYSPDGLRLAGAGYDKLRIWAAEAGGQALAAWDAPTADWRGASIRDDDGTTNGEMSSMNGDQASSSAFHTLSWHDDGRQMAFGLGDQIAVMTL